MTESYRVRRGRHRDGDETQNRLMRSLLTQTRSADSDGDNKGGDGRSQERGSIESECRPPPCSSASWCALGIPHGRARSRVVTIQGVSVCTHASTRLETMTRKRTSLTRLFLSVNLNSLCRIDGRPQCHSRKVGVGFTCVFSFLNYVLMSHRRRRPHQQMTQHLSPERHPMRLTPPNLPHQHREVAAPETLRLDKNV